MAMSREPLSVRQWDEARLDPVVFADLVLSEPLWDHQVDVVRSRARYRVLCSGRRSGKTRVFGVLALHRMFSVPGTRVLMVSAGETSVKRTHAEIVAMARAGEATASAVEESGTGVLALTLSNGSRLESVTQSERAVRSADADLLIVDEAGFVDQSVWEAAEPVVGARPGARVLISSTPWRGPGHFFHDLWRQGIDRPDAEVASWHWPTTISPLVDSVWLEGVRERSATDYFDREYLAKWMGESGAYFDEQDLMDAVEDYELVSAERARELSSYVPWRGVQRVLPAVAGVDWGMRRDANAVVLVSPLEGRRAVFVPWLAARSGWAWHDFAGHVTELAQAYRLELVASEVNGVGDAATDILREQLRGQRIRCHIAEVWTDMRRKQAGFGKIKALLQRELLVLPRDPELLKQLRSLEFEQTTAGGVRIAVPDRVGHDDLAMALMQAVSCVGPPDRWRWGMGGGTGGHLPDENARSGWFSWPQGQEKGEAW